jgi:hypothetical protein
VVIEKKYPGRAFDLPAIERSVKHLRRHAPLSYADLARFESPNHWWFEKFWVFPPTALSSGGVCFIRAASNNPTMCPLAYSIALARPG